ncbi:hypothetical protein D3C83_233350 [compost metagenome]
MQFLAGQVVIADKLPLRHDRTVPVLQQGAVGVAGQRLGNADLREALREVEARPAQMPLPH